jgi:galactose mutarotase-like enzyme
MNQYQIANDVLKITVNETGAELAGIESVVSGRQFLWGGDPSVWANHSPVLFPIVGGLKDNTFIYKEGSYSLPRHGFIRNNHKIKLTAQSDSSLTFTLTFDEETLAKYPFEFEFQITYTLYQHRIVVSHLVKNHGAGNMYFSLGAHPAFRCPLNSHESYEDYYLEFAEVETDSTWELTSEGLVSERTRPVLHRSNVLHLTKSMFDHDALIFKNLKSRRVSLRSTKSQQVISVEFEDFPYLGLWAKPGAPFICIEPWLGIADSVDTNQQLENKEGILTLATNHSFSAAYSIEIRE